VAVMDLKVFQEAENFEHNVMDSKKQAFKMFL
jgi:hypothetical protein